MKDQKYPAFAQDGISFGEEYPFVFQLSSNEKAYFNIADSYIKKNMTGLCPVIFISPFLVKKKAICIKYRRLSVSY
ncbi:hypothetical protein [Cytobacillus oceanisediminis]|uniref:Uncharacterized protein n=2 Tax=Cytobacillus oceanisediminis TaxID=665099 RepID=A0A160M7J7_9BACI|nr:hypothetical protein [Cytobacillus oceanisediminis]AND38244.1 hypothetical protein A361_03610 [Cytobacillus oceanisediminis 2691]MBU8731070.1 hypothetical protein [Cytobacillus oceanisediminis]OHX48143.1 hypothetical protein BBV17_18750 [Cytobacillus oceanisediminis]